MSVQDLAAAAWLWPRKTLSIHDLYLFGANRYNARDGQQHVWASGVFGMFGIYRRQVSAAGGVHTLLSFVLYLYHTRDTTCTTSGGVSRRKHECAEFRRYDTSQCSSAIAHLLY
jgi:hypothetical protein